MAFAELAHHHCASEAYPLLQSKSDCFAPKNSALVLLQYLLCLTANLLQFCIAVSYVRRSCILMKETKKLPYASPVEALLLSRRNNLGQLMCVPKAIGSLLSEMIRSEVRLVAASLEMKRTSHL